jgi:uncharacterized protein YjcR
MRIELSDDAAHEDVKKAYYRELIARGHNLTKIAEIAGRDPSTLRRWFRKWGWKKDWTVPDIPAAAAPALNPQPSTKDPSSNPKPANKNHSSNSEASTKNPPSSLHPITDKLVDPELRARIEKLKANRRKEP